MQLNIRFVGHYSTICLSDKRLFSVLVYQNCGYVLTDKVRSTLFSRVAEPS